MHTYKIFLASSSELEPERIAFGDKVQEINDRLNAQKRQVRFSLYKWERDTDSFAAKRKQDEYNSNIENCDIFVMLYWTKVGKYSQEEYEFAYDRYLLLGKPFVLVYQKFSDTGVDDSIKEFQYFTFVEHEQFTPTFENAKALGIAFDHEIQKLFANGQLSYSAAISLFGAPNELPQTFIGRKREIAAIQEFFDRENKGVKKQLLIFSDGGIGKTTLAANYWIQNQDKYNYCAWLFCENGIVSGIEAIAAANMKNFAELTAEYKEASLLTYLNSFTNIGKCLLVLDNVNEEQQLTEFREKYGGLQWDVLITSRLNNLTPNEIPVKCIGIEDAVELFYSYYKRESRDQTEQLVLQIVDRLNSNTLFVELFAKNLDFAARAGETLESFYKKFEAMRFGFIDDNTPVETRYTTNVHKQATTVLDVINILYDITLLEPENRTLLQLIALLPAGNYKNDLLFELFEQQDRKTFLIKLSRLNAWMQLRDDGIQVSPLVQEMVLYKCDGRLPVGYEPLIEKLSQLIDDEFRPIAKIIKTYQPIAEGVLAACTKITPHYSNTLYNLIVDLHHLKKNVLHLQSDINVSYKLLKQYIQTEEDGQGHTRDLIDAYVLFVDCCINREKERYNEEVNDDRDDYDDQKDYHADNHDHACDDGDEGNVDTDYGKFIEEALYYQQVVIQIKKMTPSDEKGITRALRKAADVCCEWHKYELGVNYYLEAYENYPKQYSTGSLMEASLQIDLALALKQLGGKKNNKYAEILFRTATETLIINQGENSLNVATMRSNLALFLLDLGGETNLKEAEILLRKALVCFISSYKEEIPALQSIRSNLAYVLRALGGEGRLSEAEGLLGKAFDSNFYNKDYRRSVWFRFESH